MPEEAPRSRAARAIAQMALERIVRHYGGLPEFVVLGGLVPELLCADATIRHAGTTDVDVQVNLEIVHGSTNAVRLEKALRAADFRADSERIWRWETRNLGTKAVVKFELLADLSNVAAGIVLKFDQCETLGAANLRGTSFAAADRVVRRLTTAEEDQVGPVEVYVTGLAGFLLAKTAAAYGRRKPKDWYDIAFVLLHNDDGGPIQAADRVVDRFGDQLIGEIRTALHDLIANFATPDAQGPSAYANQLLIDHPTMDAAEAAADAVTAVGMFGRRLNISI